MLSSREPVTSRDIQVTSSLRFPFNPTKYPCKSPKKPPAPLNCLQLVFLAELTSAFLHLVRLLWCRVWEEWTAAAPLGFGARSLEDPVFTVAERVVDQGIVAHFDLNLDLCK